MKTIRNILSVAILSGSLFLYSCTGDWDSHYSEKQLVINNVDIAVVDASILDYLQSEPSLSSMYELFQETGCIETLEKRDQLFTVLAVKNENASTSSPNRSYLAKTHISDASLSPSSLSNGQRVLMWHDKYLNVKKQENESGEMAIAFNDVNVSKIIRLNDGYIYELDSYIESPQSLYDFIAGLEEDGEYSIFREMVMSKNERIFDKANSTPTGVDNTGSTTYDSAWIVINTYFAEKGLDLTSESITATLLLPSNTVIEKARNQARKNLEDWNLLGTKALRARADTVADVFILQSAFFNKEYTREDFDNEDLTSVFSKQWRTTVQQVDLDNPMYVSNGVVYYTTDMKIPTNVLIYRLKDFYKWYEFLSADDKANYFVTENLAFDQVTTKVEPWSGWPAAGFPKIENRLLYYKVTDFTVPFKLDFTLFQYNDHGDGTYTVAPYMIPPGEYDLCIGLEQLKDAATIIGLNVYFNGEFMKEITISEQTSTIYHFDRNGQGYPEGYDSSKAVGESGTKPANYDRDGGKIGTVTITGNEPVQAKLTFTNNAEPVPDGKTIRLHHWCLKPTKNCY